MLTHHPPSERTDADKKFTLACQILRIVTLPFSFLHQINSGIMVFYSLHIVKMFTDLLSISKNVTDLFFSFTAQKVNMFTDLYKSVSYKMLKCSQVYTSVSHKMSKFSQWKCSLAHCQWKFKISLCTLWVVNQCAFKLWQGWL